MQTGKLYSLKAVIFTLAGVPITGGFVDDSIQLVPDSDLYTKTDGADGNTVYNATNIDTWTLTVHVSETSLAYSLLDSVVQAALLANSIPGVPAVLPGTVVDILSGETTTWAFGVPMRLPDRSKGAAAGSRVFVFNIKAPIKTPAVLNAVR